MLFKSFLGTVLLGILCALPFPSYTAISAPTIQPPTWVRPVSRDEEMAAAAHARAVELRDRAIDYVIQQEGGYANEQRDPGGPTKYGITQKTARRFGYVGRMADMPVGWAYLIYLQMWQISGAAAIANVHGDENGIQYFNAYVAHGPAFAAHWHPVPDSWRTCRDLNALRMHIYQSSSGWKTFGKGWTRRISDNITRCEYAYVQ